MSMKTMWSHVISEKNCTVTSLAITGPFSLQSKEQSMSTEPYTPDEVTVKAAWSEFLYLESHGMKHVDDSDAEFDRFINKAKADAWDEAYWQGVDDERTAQVLQVDVGIGVPAQANRSNPHRIKEEA